MDLKAEEKTPMILKTEILEKVLVNGDLSRLTSEQKVSHLQSVCDSLGLNVLTRPFEYLKMNGKEVLYATRNCGEQLRKIHNISLRIVSREVIDGIYIVTVNAKDKDGREDESTGAVPIEGLKGDAKANAYLKCETKAKRRVTLSICGLGLLDETEVETISNGSPLIPPSKDPVQESFVVARKKVFLSADKWKYTKEEMKNIISHRYKKDATKDLLIGELEDLHLFLEENGAVHDSLKKNPSPY